MTNETLWIDSRRPGRFLLSQRGRFNYLLLFARENVFENIMLSHADYALLETSYSMLRQRF